MAVVSALMDEQSRLAVEYLKEENRVLRERLGEKRVRLTNAQRRRLAVKAKALGRKTLGEVTELFSPDTILGWFRKLVAEKYDGSPNRKGGRPKVSREIVDLAVRLAKENRGWGHRRICSYAIYLGYSISESTVLRIMEDHGLNPSPKEKRKTTWKEFIGSHMDVLAAVDFFSVELLTPKGLVRCMVFFAIHLDTRRVEILGVKPDPASPWVKQVARNATDENDGFLRSRRYLIHDRDPLFTEGFRDILEAADVETIRIPPKSPDLNAFAERFVRSVKLECLEKMILTSQGQLEYVLEEYLEWYHRARPHSGLGGRMIDPHPQEAGGEIVCFEQLGGLLKSYRRVQKRAA
ncbi:MAG: integrase core domain-containing protein [Phycisphaerae bacterium]|nr:integrase core domain-containing protein [Phycisphaerae bacterium]